MLSVAAVDDARARSGSRVADAPQQRVSPGEPIVSSRTTSGWASASAVERLVARVGLADVLEPVVLVQPVADEPRERRRVVAVEDADAWGT